MGHPVPTDMDGDVVTEAFADGSDPASRSVETCRPLAGQDASRELDDDIEDRLQDIGYLE